MNIDPEKVKQLVLIFAELNEDYQKRLMAEAYKLQFKQSQLNQIQKEGISFDSEKDLDQEVEKRTGKCLKEVIELLDVIKKMNDTDKASVMMMLNQLSGKGNIFKESDITITINQKDVSMKEYLERNLSGADYEKAKEKVESFMDEIPKK